MPAKGARPVSTEAPARERQPESRLAVEVSRVSKTFPGKAGAVTALDELTLEARAGERLGIVGPSGCGKSTLLELVCGLQEPSAGRVAVDGREAAGERLRE